MRYEDDRDEILEIGMEESQDFPSQSRIHENGRENENDSISPDMQAELTVRKNNHNVPLHGILLEGTTAVDNGALIMNDYKPIYSKGAQSAQPDETFQLHHTDINNHMLPHHQPVKYSSALSSKDLELEEELHNTILQIKSGDINHPNSPKFKTFSPTSAAGQNTADVGIQNQPMKVVQSQDMLFP